MSQLTFAEAEYDGEKRKIRREKFLDRMDGLTPWKKLAQQQAKKYSSGKVGRKPYPLCVMLKVHVGVDESLGLIHRLTATAANVHDITQADQLLYGN